jgi:PhnB protein
MHGGRIEMFCTHIYFNGNCREAIELYKKAFNAEILTVIDNRKAGKEKQVLHAEIAIHNRKLMMNDFGNNLGVTRPDGYQLVVQFDRIEQLENAFSEFAEGSTILFPKQPTDYSPWVVQFIDKFGTRWAFMV